MSVYVSVIIQAYAVPYDTLAENEGNYVYMQINANVQTYI